MNVDEASVAAAVDSTDPPANETIKLVVTLLISEKFGKKLLFVWLTLGFVVAGYFFSAGYRYYVRNFSATLQHTYFASVGLCLMYFNYGTDTFHSLCSVFLIYLVLLFFSGTIFSVLVAFTYLMGHLLVGYASSENEYDMSWAMPQCVLTLRLIGLVWDVYDGRHSKHDKHKQTALRDTPGLLEIMAYSFFFGSFLVGPQYPLKRMRSLVSGEFNDPVTGLPRKNIFEILVSPSLVRSAMEMTPPSQGHMYPIATISSLAESMLWKSIHLCLWFRFILFRYFACWLITEGSCILAGLAYNGKNSETGADMWDGVRNVRLTSFEFGCTFQSIIDSFNYNTNQWAARYIFKRLQFLGNKSLSHLLTLVFLAIWHGLYSGYFACFFFEFICVMAERQANTILSRLPRVQRYMNTDDVMPFHPIWLFKKFLVTYGCAYGLLSFALLRFSRWWEVYANLKFSGHLLYGVGWQTFFALASYFFGRQQQN